MTAEEARDNVKKYKAEKNEDSFKKTISRIYTIIRARSEQGHTYASIDVSLMSWTSDELYSRVVGRLREDGFCVHEIPAGVIVKSIIVCW